jgi:hypothetical protein
VGIDLSGIGNLPIINATAKVSYPKGSKFNPAGLSFDNVEYTNLLSVKPLYPHWCLWAGDVDELERWIAVNEKIGIYKVLKSLDSRSLWAFSRAEDARYFCEKFVGASVDPGSATYA